jgi:hypothetical protein
VDYDVVAVPHVMMGELARADNLFPARCLKAPREPLLQHVLEHEAGFEQEGWRQPVPPIPLRHQLFVERAIEVGRVDAGRAFPTGFPDAEDIEVERIGCGNHKESGGWVVHLAS